MHFSYDAISCLNSFPALLKQGVLVSVLRHLLPHVVMTLPQHSKTEFLKRRRKRRHPQIFTFVSPYADMTPALETTCAT